MNDVSSSSYDVDGCKSDRRQHKAKQSPPLVVPGHKIDAEAGCYPIDESARTERGDSG